MSTRELVQYVKAKYPNEDAQSSYGRFVAYRDLKPEINMKEYLDIFSSAGANNFETTSDQEFTPTHVAKDGRKVQVTFEEGGTKKFLFEDGATGSHPLDENMPKGYKFKDQYREIGVGDTLKDPTPGVNVKKLLDDLGDAIPGVGLSVEDVGRTERRAAAREKLVKEHLPALIADAKKAGLEFRVFLEQAGRTKKQVDLLVHLATQSGQYKPMPPKKDDVIPDIPGVSEQKAPTVEEQKKHKKKVETKVNEALKPGAIRSDFDCCKIG